MASPPFDSAGTFVQFLTSGFSPLARKITLEVGRDTYIATTFSTTVAMVYNASTLHDLKYINIEVFFDPKHADLIPVNGAPETFQIVYPLAANSLWSMTAFVESFEFGASKDQLMSGTIRLKGSGTISYFDRLPVFNDDWNAVYNDDSNLVYAG